MNKILVIKLGALGDFVQAMGPAAAIRRHHGSAHITLLTANLFAELAWASPYFDDVWIDPRPRGLDIAAWLGLRAKLRSGHFDRVYDLQTSDRSSLYFYLMGPGRRPEWSGIARGASHPHANPRRDFLHTLDRQAEQLAQAGISDTPLPDLSWAEADLSLFHLPEPFALLVPGGAAHRPGKRWPAEHYTALAQKLAEQGLTPVFLGAQAEQALIASITATCSSARDLAGRTNLLELAALARRARAAVGNDTGPMHLLAAAGCPSLVLFSQESDPALCAPRGRRVTILRRDSLAALTPEEAWEALRALSA